MPTEADELWIMAVSTRPINIPSNGLLKDVNSSWNFSDSLSGANTPSMVVIPKNSTPRPTRIPAMSLFLFFLEKSIINAPIHMSIGANDEGLNNFINTLCSPRSPSRKICAVAVLPIFAPNTTGIA